MAASDPARGGVRKRLRLYVTLRRLAKFSRREAFRDARRATSIRFTEEERVNRVYIWCANCKQRWLSVIPRVPLSRDKACPNCGRGTLRKGEHV